jgi:hypothetical protein
LTFATFHAEKKNTSSNNFRLMLPKGQHQLARPILPLHVKYMSLVTAFQGTNNDDVLTDKFGAFAQ